MEQLLLISHSHILDVLKSLTNPVANIRLRNMIELNADFGAVSVFISFNNVTQLPNLLFLEDGRTMR